MNKCFCGCTYALQLKGNLYFLGGHGISHPELLLDLKLAQLFKKQIQIEVPNLDTSAMAGISPSL